MVEILIEGKFLDMFPDAVVSGNYSPIETSGSARFSLPYTNKFTVPLTEHNRSILGYNKRSIDFDKKELKGEVIIDGESIMYGLVFVDFVEYEHLDEIAEIQIVDILSYILDKGKDKKLSEVFDTDEFKDHKYTYIGNTTFNSSPYSICYVDQCGYMNKEKIADADYCFLKRANNQEMSLPYVFDAKKLVNACFEVFGVKLDYNSLPYDLIENTVGVSFPIIEYSGANKSNIFKPTMNTGFSCITVAGNENFYGGVFNDKKEFNLLCSDSVPLEGMATFNNTKTKSTKELLDKPEDQAALKLNIIRMYQRSLISNEFVLKPEKITLKKSSSTTKGFRYTASTGAVIEIGSISDNTKFELWVYHLAFDGSIHTRYKIANFSLDENLNPMDIEITDDYLYADMISVDASENMQIVAAIHSIEESNFGGKFKLFSDAVTNAIWSEPNYKLESTFSFDIEFSYMESTDEQVNQKVRVVDVIDSLYSSEMKYGTFGEMTSEDASSKRVLKVVNMKNSFDMYDLTISDFITDFINRFNLRPSSVGKLISLSPSTGSDDMSIDITGYINSELTVSKKEDEEPIVAFDIKNATFGLHQDKFFDGSAYADSRNWIGIDKSKTKAISLKSSVIPPVASGKPIKSLSDDVTSLVKEFGNAAVGVSYYEPAGKRDFGIRYGYISNEEKSVFPLVPLTVTQDTPDMYARMNTYYDRITESQDSSIRFNTYLADNELGKRYSGTTKVYRSADRYAATEELGIVKFIIDNGILFLYDYEPNSYAATVQYTDAYIPLEQFPYNEINTWYNFEKRLGICSLSYDKPNNRFLNKNSSDLCIDISSFSYVSGNDDYRPELTFVHYIKMKNISALGSSKVYCMSADYETQERYRQIELPVSQNGYTINNINTGSSLGVKLRTFVPFTKNSSGEYNTLSFSLLGTKAPSGCTTAFDRYFKEHEDSVLSDKSLVLEADVYMNRDTYKKLLQGYSIELYGKRFALLDVSDIDFTSNKGGIARIKIAKIRMSSNESNFITADGKIIRLADGKIFNVKQL